MAYADSFLTRKPGGPSKKAKRTPTEIGQTVPTSSKGQAQKTKALSKVSRGKSVSRVYTPSSTATSASSSSSGSRSRPAAPRLSPSERARRRERRLTRSLNRIDRAFKTEKPVRADRKTSRTVRNLLKDNDREAPRRVVISPKLEGRKVKVGAKAVKVAPGVVKKAHKPPAQKPQKVKAPKPPRKEDPRIKGPKEKRVARKLTKAAKKTQGGLAKKLNRAFGPNETIKPEETAIVAEAHGLPGITYSQAIAPGESGHRPGIRNPDDGYPSLFQITPSVQSEETRAKFDKIAAKHPGGYSNPIVAAKQAKVLAKGSADEGVSNYVAFNPSAPQGHLPGGKKAARKVLYGEKKPIPKPLKAKAKKVLGEKATKQVVKQAKGTPTKRPGAWAGTKANITEVVGKKNIARATSLKRADTVGGASSTSSMHHVSQKTAFAADLPYEQPILDRITKKLKIPKMSLGQDFNGTSSAYPGYEVELLTSEHGTGPHIHLGMRWGGGELPEGTTLGGGGTGATSSVTAITSGGGTASASTPAGGTSKRGKARRRRRRRGETPQERLARVRAVGKRLTPAQMREYGIDPSLESFSEYVKRQPTKVGL